ncbi:hypothetical protein L6164_016571 [Bauhinia variegata]|uniref:Uncharacterized protein n=1 Tax=Bauhinia variegata TaxID=167791 RepID=A0ACB9NPS7_BAUVA|nr:hypothetical protein L6164_016571 [Bauhinia variegata]
MWMKECRQLKHIIVKEENGIDADEMEIFPNLKYIKIYGCIDLEYIFPISVARTLLSLESMEIHGCGQLKHIIKNEGEGATTTHISRKNEERRSRPYFQKLRVLRVSDCNELKCLFSLSNAAQLSQLEILSISKAAQLEQAFGYKNKDVSCNTDKTMLPNLSQLTLEMLPNFVDICRGLKVHAVKLRSMRVVECPKFDSIYRWSTQNPILT